MKLKQIALWTLVPLFMVSIYVVSSLGYLVKQPAFYNLKKSFTYTPTNSNNNKILQSDVISGEFVSAYHNLGTVSLRFNTFDHINLDWIKFRVKEKGKDEWIYQSTHYTDQLQNHQFFPFGFPVIEYSQGKVYYFEIESISGSNADSVAIDIQQPALQTTYSYQDKANFKEFLPLKLTNLLQEDNNYLAASLSFLFLFFLYYLLLGLKKRSLLPYLIFLQAITIDLFYYPFFNKSLLFAFSISVLIWYLSRHGEKKFKIFLITLLTIAGTSVILNQEFVFQRIFFWIFISITAIIGKRFLNNTLQFNMTAQVTKLKSTTKKFFKPVYYIFAACFFIILIHATLTDLLEFAKFFQDFFLQKQLAIFVKTTGIYIFVLYGISIVVFSSVVLKLKRQDHKQLLALLAILLLVVVYFGQHKIFNLTTSGFRDQITILSVQPTRTTLWDEVTIKGVNFKELPFSGKVLIDGQEQHIVSWDKNKIVFTTDPAKTKSGKLKVIDKNGKESNTIKFKYYDFHTGKTIE